MPLGFPRVSDVVGLPDDCVRESVVIGPEFPTAHVLVSREIRRNVNTLLQADGVTFPISVDGMIS